MVAPQGGDMGILDDFEIIQRRVREAEEIEIIKDVSASDEINEKADALNDRPRVPMNVSMKYSP